LSPLAVAEVIASRKQKELGMAVVDIGASTTSMAVFEEEKLIHTAILPVGSEHITADMAIGLRCPINLAERIKIEHGNSDSSLFSSKDKVDITDLVKEEEVNDDIREVSRKYIAEIIEARVEEIFDMVDQELKKIDRSGMLPAGVILSGGGAKLPGITEVAKNKLRLPVAVGEIRNMDVIIDKISDPRYFNAVGLILWAESESEGEKRSFVNKGKETMGKTIKRFKDLFSRLMP